LNIKIDKFAAFLSVSVHTAPQHAKGPGKYANYSSPKEQKSLQQQKEDVSLAYIFLAMYILILATLYKQTHSCTCTDTYKCARVDMRMKGAIPTVTVQMHTALYFKSCL